MWRLRTFTPSSLGQPILSELYDCTHDVNSVQSFRQPGIDENALNALLESVNLARTPESFYPRT